ELAHRSFAALERRALLGPQSPLLVVNSRMVRAHARRYYGIPPERVRVIPYAIDPARLNYCARPRLPVECRSPGSIRPGWAVPVVTSRHNGAAELMSPPREGFVIDDPHDHAALAGAMAALLDPVRRDACGRAARQAAAAWTIEHHYRAWLDVFADVAARRRAA